ncbi:TetR/AcrR family transcriptional regulator, partial [Edaphobacter aggregans]|uniref:TetR/AcrR family transcriptional regulator n=1 Tax=Edaphobacter aggregans TaxID=570835 RepID=UPI000553BA9C
MRRSREEAAATRQRIVDTASHEFRENGIAETGLSELMGAAGLTQGGFYRHFESKDQLVGEAIERSFDQMIGELAASIKGKPPDAAFKAVVDGYLSA